ncbi:cysteine--tRNA ligase [bacterium]|nr:cysteine--tRNA ligase [bacterium]
MLKLFNSYSAQLEEFQPLQDNKVSMYVCGPTVYDHPHLGHARCYITWDVVYRFLKFLGYDVTYCRNVTDVDDKILKKADEQGVSPDDIAKKYYDIFSDSMKKLNTLKPTIEPFATKNLGEMISLVKDLQNKGFAYEVDGDVYFRVKKFNKYGQLSKQPIDDLVAGARVEASDKKEDVLDFALWKKDEKFGYKCPWGKGRPGWHIECSAMARKHLGKTIDIHAGGADLQFPHHENEIAQSECANDCQFSKYWLHNGFVTIGQEKMSKSLKNFVTIESLLNAYDADTLRLFILTNHYRMPIEFTDDALLSAKNGVARLKNAVKNVMKFINNQVIEMPENEYVKSFTEVMCEDFNTSKALSILFDLANKANKAKDENDAENAKELISTLIYLSKTLGFTVDKIEYDENDLKERLLPVLKDFDIAKDTPIKDAIAKILEQRQIARNNKDWTTSDKIRDILAQNGIAVKDTKEGSVLDLI